MGWVVIGFHAGDTVYRTNAEFDQKGDSTSMRATSENGTQIFSLYFWNAAVFLKGRNGVTEQLPLPKVKSCSVVSSVLESYQMVER